MELCSHAHQSVGLLAVAHGVMNMRNLSTSILVLALSLVGNAGCGSSGPELFPVSGVVKYQGQPLAGATVTYIPEAKEGGFAMATTDAEGRYEMKTGAENGVVAGRSAITVTKFAAPGAAAATPMSPQEMEKQAMSGQLQKSLDDQGKSSIPEQYGTAGTSGLSYEVKKSGTNENNIDLN